MIQDLLREHGAQLVRSRKHQIWKFPDGRIYVMAQTPSDHRSELNQLADLKRFLGLTKTEATVGERRHRKAKRNRIRLWRDLEPARLRPTLREQLRAMFG